MNPTKSSKPNCCDDGVIVKDWLVIRVHPPHHLSGAILLRDILSFCTTSCLNSPPLRKSNICSICVPSTTCTAVGYHSDFVSRSHLILHPGRNTMNFDLPLPHELKPSPRGGRGGVPVDKRLSHDFKRR